MAGSAELPELMEKALRRLDVIINLMIDRENDAEATLRSKVLRLQSLGLAPAEIGRILGRPTNQITAAVTKGVKAKSR
jgi:hypothetical protein